MNQIGLLLLLLLVRLCRREAASGRGRPKAAGGLEALRRPHLCSTAAPSPWRTFCLRPSGCAPSRCSGCPEATSPATGTPRGNYPPGTKLPGGDRRSVRSRGAGGRGRTWLPASLGCGASYRSSCRKGSELTSSGTLDGWKNSLAANSPDVLLRWKSRGVKLNLPGSGDRTRPSASSLVPGSSLVGNCYRTLKHTVVRLPVFPPQSLPQSRRFSALVTLVDGHLTAAVQPCLQRTPGTTKQARTDAFKSTFGTLPPVFPSDSTLTAL